MAQWHLWGNNGISSPHQTNELHDHHPDRDPLRPNPAGTADL